MYLRFLEGHGKWNLKENLFMMNGQQILIVSSKLIASITVTLFLTYYFLFRYV